VQLTVDLADAANFATLRADKTFFDISDISSLGLSKIRPGYFPIFFILDDGNAKSVFKSKLFIFEAQDLIKDTDPVVPTACDPYLTSPNAV
jgi:hypothetical protein